MPQDTSVCVYQADSLSGQSPTPVGPDSASLYTARTCFICGRVIEDGHPFTMIHVDNEAEPAIGKLHSVCADTWLKQLTYMLRIAK